jgi:hypothetical protein
MKEMGEKGWARGEFTDELMCDAPDSRDRPERSYRRTITKNHGWKKELRRLLANHRAIVLQVREAREKGKSQK